MVGLFERFTDVNLNLIQGFSQFGSIFSAGLRQGWPAAAAATDNFSNLLDELTSMQAAFDQVFSYSGDHDRLTILIGGQHGHA